MSNAPPRPPAERFAVIMESVYQALAAQGIRGTLVGPLLFLVCGRLRRAAARVLLLAAQLRAGTLRFRPPRERTSHSPRPAPPEPAEPPKLRLPRRFGWLPRLVREVGFGRSQLQHLLAQPEMAELIAAAAPIAHHIRPICRILGAKPPPGLFPPRRRRPPTPAAAPPPGPRKPSHRPPQATLSRTFPSLAPPKRPHRRAPSRPPPAGPQPPA